jgi:hypothetical protein
MNDHTPLQQFWEGRNMGDFLVADLLPPYLLTPETERGLENFRRREEYRIGNFAKDAMLPPYFPV